MKKRIVHFRNFANAPKNWAVNICFIVSILISFKFNRKQANLKNESKETKLIGIVTSYALGFVFRDLIMIVQSTDKYSRSIVRAVILLLESFVLTRKYFIDFLSIYTRVFIRDV